MTQQPPCGPNGEAGEETSACIEALWELTREILTQSEDPDIPVLSQLILHRGRLIDELGKRELGPFPETEQAALQEKLLSCREMDLIIDQNLSGFRDQLDEQVRCLKEGQTLIDKYKIPEPEDSLGTRSREA